MFSALKDHLAAIGIEMTFKLDNLNLEDGKHYAFILRKKATNCEYGIDKELLVMQVEPDALQPVEPECNFGH